MPGSGSTQSRPPFRVSGATITITDTDSESDEYDTLVVRSIVEQVSSDGRRLNHTAVGLQGSSPVKRRRLSAVPLPHDSHAGVLPLDRGWLDDERYALVDEESGLLEERTDEPTNEPSTRSRAVKPADKAMARWRDVWRDTYLDTLLWRDGYGKANEDTCPECGAASPRYRCEDCVGSVVLCDACCVKVHERHPLHIVSWWNGHFFQRHSLKELGVRVQLGHHTHTRCPAPHAAHEGFVVIHDNGIHEVTVDFCGCERQIEAGEHHLQLLRFGWYPSTDQRPQTCVTFTALDRFILCSHQSKMTAYDFYCVLERLTDNTGVKPPNRYQPFMRVARQYRHLLLLKRGGRGHSASGTGGTQSGELVLTCPACPRPGVNLPEGFENAPPEDQCLYVMVLALDACFRLKRRMISSELRDPGLGTGWAYVVEPEPYRSYLRTVTDQKEMSTCSGLAALDYANTKFSRGYSTTGVVMGVCARHEFVQPNGVGDLQKGERYANTDWIFASILRHLDPRVRKLVSYDIVCQWALYLLERLKLLPPMLRFYMVSALFRFVIPKMHIRGHIVKCQLKYSLNYMPGSGQTDGEGIERPWANIGGIATSTRVSGPGARHDALDCHWSFWNWLKTTGLPDLLRRRLDVATKEEVVQRDAFNEFSVGQEARVPLWKKMVEEYEADDSKPNPYQSSVKGLTEAEVRRKLEEEEARDEEAGVPRVHEVSASAFVALGLDLEESQRKIRLQAELKKASSAASAKESLKELRSKFNRQLLRFRTLQATYQPSAIQSLTARDVPADELPEDVPLMLPSALPMNLQMPPGCMGGLAEVENSLREAQCNSALVSLRNQLHVKSRLLLYKKNHARHQAMNTRARTLVSRNESKIRLHSEKFQMAWQARLSLAAGNERAVGWPRLQKTDIRCMEDPEELLRKKKKQGRAAGREAALRRESGLPPEDVDMDSGDDEPLVRGEKYREVSWIWKTTGTSGTDAELDEALRIEWAKAWARARRWTEERRMLEEEWRRLGETFKYQDQVWRERAGAVPVGVIAVDLAQGKIAYAAKQANLYRQLAHRAEAVRTAEPLRKGQKRARLQPLPSGFTAAAEDDGDAESDEERDDERGDINSEEELLMGGEVDD